MACTIGREVPDPVSSAEEADDLGLESDILLQSGRAFHSQQRKIALNKKSSWAGNVVGRWFGPAFSTTKRPDDHRHPGSWRGGQYPGPRLL